MKNRIDRPSLAALVAATTAFVLGCAPAALPRDSESGCAIDTPRALTAMALDASEAFTERQRELVDLLVRRAWEAVPTDGELRLYLLTGQANDTVPALTICKEPPLGLLDGPKTKQFKDHARRQEQRRERLAEWLAQVTAGKGVAANKRASRIYEWLASIQSALPDHYSSRSMYVVSDFRQYSPRFTNRNLPSEGVNLSGWRLNAVILGDGQQMPKAWTQLFQGSGATPIEVTMEGLPSSLLR